MKAAIAFQLVLQRIEDFTYKFSNLPTAQASHVNVIRAQFALVVMAFAVQMHEIEFIDQPLPLQQFERAINRAAIH